MKLARPRARLERAKVHQREFGRIWNEFLTEREDEPYVPFVRVDANGKGELHVDPVDLPRAELALEFGEFLYQLRAALDSLVYETAIVVSGQDPPPNAEELEFPIRPSEASFRNAARKIAPLAEHHRIWIEDLQPYRAEYETEGLEFSANALNTINDLARKDRHRSLRVIASWGANRNPQFDLPPGCSLEWVHVTEDGLLERDSEVATFKVRGWAPGLEMHANPNLTIDVTVEDVPPPADDEDTLSFRAMSWVVIVGSLIDGFEDSLKGDPRKLFD